MKKLSLSCLAVLLSFCSAHLRAAELPRLVIDSGGHMGFIRDVVFTRDGRFLISAGDDKVIRIWDVGTGKTIRTIRGQIGEGDEGKINALALSPDNKYLAAGGEFPGTALDRGAIRIYDFQSGQLIGLLRGHTDQVLSLAFSPDSHHLASSSEANDTTVRIWEMTDQSPMKQVYVLSGHTRAVESVAFSSDGKRIVSVSLDATLRLWNAELGTLIKKIPANNPLEQFECVAFSPSDRYIATGSRSRKILLWDGQTGTYLKVVGQHAQRILSLSFNHDGNLLLASSEGGECTIFPIPSGPIVAHFRHDTTVAATAFSPDGKIAVTAGGTDKGIYLRKSINGEILKKLVGQGQTIWAVGFAKDGQSIAFGKEKAIRDTNHLGPLRRTILLKQGDTYQVALGDPAQNEANFFRALERYDGLQLRQANAKPARLQIISGGRVTLLNGKYTSSYDTECYTFTHDGRYVVNGAEKGYLTLHLTATGEQLREFVGHTNRVLSVAVSPDNRTLASCSSDQTIKLWDIESGRNLLTMFVGDDEEWVAWTPEGYYTSSLHGDKYIGWHINQGVDKAATFYSAAQFQRDFYRPDVVAEYLSTRGIQAAVQRANDRRKEGGFGGNVLSATDITGLLPPSVTITSPGNRESTVTEQNIVVHAEVRSATLPITNIKVFLNGSPQGTFVGNSNSSALELKLKLEPGGNTLAIIAFNKQSYSEPEIRKINYVPGRTRTELDQYHRPKDFAAYLETVFHPAVEASNLVMRETAMKADRTIGTMMAATLREFARLDHYAASGLQARRPEVVVSVPSDMETTVEDENLTVKVTAFSFTSPITEIKVSVNGKFSASQKLRTDSNRQDVELNVTLEQGSNELSITASDKESTSEPQTRRVTCTNCTGTSKPDLIFLGIGISKYQNSAWGSDFQDLSFADKDVDDIAKTFETQNRLLPERARVFNKVFSNVIPNAQANKQAILEGLTWMEELAKKNSNNVHVLYLAGHGGMDSHEKYYFFSINHSPSVPLDTNDVPWSVVMDSLTHARGKAVIFIDTCHAGGTGGDTNLAMVYRSYYENFVSIFTFIASDASGVSFEDPNLQHGAFTKAVLDGLRGGADIASGDEPKDGKVDVDELGIYIKRQVPKLAPKQRAGYYNYTGFETLPLFSTPP